MLNNIAIIHYIATEMERTCYNRIMGDTRLDTDDDFLTFAKFYMELLKQDIAEGHFDYSSTAKVMYTQPRSFLFRMLIKFGINPYDKQ